MICAVFVCCKTHKEQSNKQSATKVLFELLVAGGRDCLPTNEPYCTWNSNNSITVVTTMFEDTANTITKSSVRGVTLACKLRLP